MPGTVSCLSVTLLLTVCLLAVHDVQGQYRRVCYFTSWSQYRAGAGKFTTGDVDPDLCTHIIYSFFKFEDVTWRLIEDEWNTRTMLTNLVNLRNSNPDLKILIAVGGYTFGPTLFSKMSSTAEGRQAFVSSVLQTLSSYNVQGLDLDWEYPGDRPGSTPADKGNFILLCKDLKEAFQAQPQQYLLTAAAPASYRTIYAGYTGEAAQYLDFVNVMAYDYNGNWNSVTGHNAPLYSVPGDVDMRFSVTETLRVYNEELGIPRNKLVLGMPTFGRTWTLTNPASTGVHAPGTTGPTATYTLTQGQLAYYEVCELQPFNSVFDTAAQVPYGVSGSTWVTYDDVASLEIKTDLVINGGYGGAMFWVLDYDDFSNMCGQGEFPLINAVKNKLLQAGGVTDPTTTTRSTTTTTTTTTTPTTTTTTTTTTTPRTTTTTTPTTTTTTTPTTTTATTTTTTTQPVNIDCREKTDFVYAQRFGLYANVMDCRKFHFCWGMFSNSQCFGTYFCRNGLLFDVLTLTCKPQPEVTCYCAVNLG